MIIENTLSSLHSERYSANGLILVENGSTMSQPPRNFRGQNFWGTSQNRGLEETLSQGASARIIGKLHQVSQTVKLFALQSALTSQFDLLHLFFLAFGEAKNPAIGGIFCDAINDTFHVPVEAKTHILLEVIKVVPVGCITGKFGGPGGGNLCKNLTHNAPRWSIVTLSCARPVEQENSFQWPFYSKPTGQSSCLYAGRPPQDVPRLQKVPWWSYACRARADNPGPTSNPDRPSCGSAQPCMLPPNERSDGTIWSNQCMCLTSCEIQEEIWPKRRPSNSIANLSIFRQSWAISLLKKIGAIFDHKSDSDPESNGWDGWQTQRWRSP